MQKPSIGILGAGKVGIVLAQLALKAGYTVYIAGSTAPTKIALSIKVLAPGATALTKEEVIQKAQVIILALPLSKYRTIPTAGLDGKIVIDAMNYWNEVDGDYASILQGAASSSELIQSYLPHASVVKGFSHMGYHELHDSPLPKGYKNRKAIAIAGNDEKAVDVVATIINEVGFDPLILGILANGKVLEPGYPGFGTRLGLHALSKVLS